MRKIFQKTLFTLALLAGISADAAVNSADRAQLRGGALQQLLKNPGYEAGRGDWTTSGAAVALVTSGSNLLSGKSSITFDAANNAEYIQTSLYSIPEGLKNKPCLARIYYKGGDGTNVLKVLDGTGALISSRTFTGDTTKAEPLAFNFNCPSSGTMRLRVEATQNATSLALDDAYLGEADNISQISQATPLVSAYVGSDQAVSSAAETTIVYQTELYDLVNGYSTGTGVFTAQKPGKVSVRVTALLQSATAGESYTLRIKKGSTVQIENSGAPAGALTQVYLSAAGTIDVAAGDTISASVTSTADTSYTLRGLQHANNLFIDYLPANSQDAYSIPTANWKVDANISGANPSLGIANVAAYTGIEDAALTLVNNSGGGNLTASIPCSSTNAPTGLTCAAGSESVGVSFVLPAAGDVAACVDFAWTGTTGAVSGNFIAPAFQIVETPTNAQTISQEGKGRTAALAQTPTGTALSFTSPYRSCGTFTFASAGQKVLRLMYEQLVSGTPGSSAIQADASASVGQRDVHWTVWPLSQQVPAPILFGGAPTQQRITATGAGTYTTPAGVKYIKVRMVGAGGGGAGSGTASQGNGASGGTTTFGNLSAGGGGGGPGGNNYGGVEGTATIGAGFFGTALSGGRGSSLNCNTSVTNVSCSGGSGGVTVFGGSGAGGPAAGSGGVNAGGSATANTGAGGGGGGTNYSATANFTAGGGGGSGAFIEAYATTPASSYSYSVGSGAATGGSSGTNGAAGGNGGSGYIEVTEYYQ